MDNKRTLKQQFQSMNTGLTIVTEVDRATAFVNAKRAGITITTKEIDGKLHVTKTGDVIASSKPEKTLLDQVREITTADRLALFENFELCCGMNRGDCVCEIDKPSQPITNEPKDAQIALETPAIAYDVQWKFTPEKVWYDETNTPYRRQYHIANGRPVYRVVEVNEFDHEVIERIK